MSKKGGGGFKTNPSSHPGSDGRWEAVRAKIEAMASFKKSFESLKGTSHSAAKGVTDSAVQAAQDAVQQVADSSKETVNIAAQEASRQSHAAIGKAADTATDTIKEFGQKMESK